jgi:5-methylcytosine-specific restriction endonuclease McrA
MNTRITPKDRALLKSAINRVFSRSELRRSILNAAIIEHSDPSRPRVKTWFRCEACKNPEAKSYAEVDHIKPKIGFNEKFEDLALDEYVDRVWCSEKNLQALCKKCHKEKSKGEAKLRREAKRGSSSRNHKMRKRATRR